MHIISVKTLRDFWEKYPDAEQALRVWNADVSRVTWKNPAEIKQFYPTTSFLQANRIVFNIRGNNYWLVVKVDYHLGRVYIRFIGTHEEYDRIDAETV